MMHIAEGMPFAIPIYLCYYLVGDHVAACPLLRKRDRPTGTSIGGPFRVDLT